jgi:hypothetical protein
MGGRGDVNVCDRSASWCGISTMVTQAMRRYKCISTAEPWFREARSIGRGLGFLNYADGFKYILNSDPEETHNHIEQYPEKFGHCSISLSSWLDSFVPDTYLDSLPEPNEVVTQQLQDLGYLE